MGFDYSEFERSMKKFDKGLEELEKHPGVSLGELFNSRFMQKHTDCTSIDDFLEQSGFDCSSVESFEAIPEADMDEYVRNHTSFKSWQEMLAEADGEYLAKKLGF